MAGRASTLSYITYSIFVTGNHHMHYIRPPPLTTSPPTHAGFIYPVVVHWTWSEDAWLYKGDGTTGLRDFAGSGVVHLTGGVCALVGAKMLKPRINRLDGDGNLRDVRPHSVPLIAMGGLVLVVGACWCVLM